MSDSPTDRELLQQILWRLGRIEEHLGIGAPEEPKAFDYQDKPSGEPPRPTSKEPEPVRTPISHEPKGAGVSDRFGNLAGLVEGQKSADVTSGPAPKHPQEPGQDT